MFTYYHKLCKVIKHAGIKSISTSESADPSNKVVNGKSRNSCGRAGGSIARLGADHKYGLITANGMKCYN